jgi:hypothetical protein
MVSEGISAFNALRRCSCQNSTNSQERFVANGALLVRSGHAIGEGGLCVTTNAIESAFSLFKRGVVGTWRKVSVKTSSRLPARDDMAFQQPEESLSVPRYDAATHSL